MGPHDDLWSLLYILIHLTVGSLPWSDETDKAKAGELKIKCNHKELCTDNRLPSGTVKILNHLTKLTYYDTPDYNLIARCLQ